ncbi:MAG: hypothetical protein HY865_16170 [Chloroflexi bacterium]|nr:hypothetical protein [Chloroflexota bacterium]
MNTTSASYVLKPLSLAEILDQAIRLYRNNFFKFIGILAIPYIPLIVLQGAMSVLVASSTVDMLNAPTPASDPFMLFQNPNYWVGMLGSIFGSILQFILVQGVATAALTRAVADNYMGRSTGILEAYQKLGNSWARLLLTLLLAIVVVVIISIWLLIPCVGWFTGLGMLAFASLVVIPLVAPVIVLEKHGATTSLRRAWDLGRNRFWWIIGFVFVLYLFSQIVVTGPTVLISYIFSFVAASNPESLEQYTLLSTVIQTLVTMIFSLLYLPLQLTAMTVVYFDLRVRSEGLDLALQSTEAAGGEAGSSFLPEITPAPQGSLVTGTEIGYFALLSIGAAAIYFILVGVLAGAMLAFLP